MYREDVVERCQKHGTRASSLPPSPSLHASLPSFPNPTFRRRSIRRLLLFPGVISIIISRRRRGICMRDTILLA